MATLGVSVNRIRRFYSGAYHRQQPPSNKAYLSLVAYEVGQEVIADVLNEQFAPLVVPSVERVLNPLSAVRLVQSLFLGLAMCLLNPLELTFKRETLSIRGTSPLN